MDTAFSTVDVKLHQFSLRSSTSRAPLLTPTQTLANTCIPSLLPYLPMYVHTHVCTYVHLYAMYVVPGYRGMAGMFSRGEPFGTYHTLNGVTTLSVVSPHSQWRHHTLNGVTTLSVASPHSRWRHHTLGGVTTLPVVSPHSLVSPHSQWCHHTPSGVTTQWMPQPCVASLHPPPPLYFNACVDILSQ